MMLRGAGPVKFDIETESFCSVDDFHQPRNTVVQVSPEEGGRFGRREIGVLLEPRGVLRQQERRIELLAELSVGMLGNASVAVGILVPEKLVLVERASDF